MDTLGITIEEIERRKRFLQFDGADEERLSAINDLAKTYAEPVIEALYHHLLSFPETERFFANPATLERVKRLQVQYFLRLTEGSYEADYVEGRLKIGAAHERIGLDVKHYLGSYSLYLREIAPRLFGAFPQDAGRAVEVYLSLMKLIFLDIGLAIDTYIFQRERTIERQQKAIGEFVLMVSHEFRTALVGIQGFSELMRDEATTVDDVKQFAADIYADATRINRLINEMLSLDRMETGRIMLQRVPVDLNHAVLEAVNRAEVSSSKHVIKTNLEPAAPPVMGDAAWLSQVITNLLSNAVKYSPAGSEVLVTSRVHDGNVQISVRDQGPGIPPEFLDRLFGRYDRYEGNAKGQGIGTGLGLATSRQIVEMHSGRIWVESTVGVGSEFFFMVPVDARRLKIGDRRQRNLLHDQERGS
jgi:signal transduction histidine kinase